jgi:AcrR family transcriptional regulator
MTMVIQRRRNVTNRGLAPQKLRQRIEQAALTLFKKSGFDGTSVDQIVARAGVSKGAFFIFFPTKADALIVYFRELDARLAESRTALNPERPLPALKKFFGQAEKLLREEGDLVQTLARVIWSHPSLMDADRHSAMRDRRGFAEFIERARACGTIRRDVKAAIAADALGDLWTGSLLLWLAEGQRYSLAESVTPKLRLLFSGLAPKEAR